MNAEKLVQSYKNNKTVGDGRRMDMSQKHYEIEVFWHVLHLADGTGNVSDSTINRTSEFVQKKYFGHFYRLLFITHVGIRNDISYLLYHLYISFLSGCLK